MNCLKNNKDIFDSIKGLFIDYNECVELKKLGFDEPCFAHYSTHSEYPDPIIISFDSDEIKDFNKSDDTISCPLFQQVEEWIEQFDMFISRDFSTYFLVWDKIKENRFSSICESECILKAIEIIKKIKND